MKKYERFIPKDIYNKLEEAQKTNNFEEIFTIAKEYVQQKFHHYEDIIFQRVASKLVEVFNKEISPTLVDSIVKKLDDEIQDIILKNETSHKTSHTGVTGGKKKKRINTFRKKNRAKRFNKSRKTRR